MLNHMFVSDAKAFVVALLVTVRETLIKRFQAANRSTISLAAKMALMVKMNPSGNIPMIMRRLYRDLLAQYTMTTDEVDTRGYFVDKATKNVEASLQGKEISRNALLLLIETERVKLMSVHESVQAFVIPVKLWGRQGTVWLVKAPQAIGWFCPPGMEMCDTHSWVSRVIREDWKTVGRKIKALSMVLDLLEIEDGPDSSGLFDVSDTGEIADFEEAMEDMDSDEAGEPGEEIESDVTERLKLFEREDTMGARLEALINAPGGVFARTNEAELRRIQGKTWQDEEAEFADGIINGEQVISIETLNGEIVEKVNSDYQFEGYLQYLIHGLFVAHQTFHEYCAPKQLGSNGFVAGRPFFIHGFGRGRLAVKGKDSFLLFGTQYSPTQIYEAVKESLAIQGYVGKNEFQRLREMKTKTMNLGREIWGLKGFEGQTLALRFRRGTDTSNYIQRLARKLPLNEA